MNQVSKNIYYQAFISLLLPTFYLYIFIENFEPLTFSWVLLRDTKHRIHSISLLESYKKNTAVEKFWMMCYSLINIFWKSYAIIHYYKATFLVLLKVTNKVCFIIKIREFFPKFEWFCYLFPREIILILLCPSRVNLPNTA